MNSSPEPSQHSQGFAALAPPEGSGVLRVDSLPEVMRTEAGFFSHFLIEVVPNAIYHQTWKQKDLKDPGFPRGDYTRKNAPLKDAIAYYASTSVYHVEENGGWKSGGTRALFHSTDYSYSWIRGPNKAVLLAFPLADYRRYPRLVIDTTLPVRGLYFPQLFSEPYYKGLCRVSQVLFYKHDAIYIPFTSGSFEKDAQWHPSVGFITHKGDRHTMSGDKGLHYFGDKCLDIRIAELMIALSIDMRDMNPIEIPIGLPVTPIPGVEQQKVYEHPAFQYMNSLGASSVGGHGGPPYHQISRNDFGPYHVWMDAHISKNEGIEYVFKPADESTLLGIIKTLVGSALNLIPFVGPLASVSWSLIFDAITDPDKLRELGNLTGVETDILKMQLKEISKLAKGLKIKKGHWDVGNDDDILRDLERKAIEEALAQEDREANEHALPVDKPTGAIVFATNQSV